MRSPWALVCSATAGEPRSGAGLGALILACAVIPLRLAGIRAADMNWHLLFMGAGFLLIETNAVTALALIFGSTWQVNSIVIGAILVMILMANLLTWRFPALGFAPLYTCLGLALVFNYGFNFSALSSLVASPRLLISG